MSKSVSVNASPVSVFSVGFSVGDGITSVNLYRGFADDVKASAVAHAEKHGYEVSYIDEIDEITASANIEKGMPVVDVPASPSPVADEAPAKKKPAKKAPAKKKPDETPAPVNDETPAVEIPVTEAPAKKKPAKKAKKPAETPAVEIPASPAPVADEAPETPASPAEPLELIETAVSLAPLVKAFEKAFSIVNLTFYNNELESPVITIQQGAKERAYGWVSVAKVWHEEKHGDFRELNISSEYLKRDFSDVVTTLMHECVHIKNLQDGVQDTARRGIRHNKNFAETAEKHGLQGYKPDDYDSVGFRVRMTEETASLVESGLFDDLKASLTMFRDETKKKQAKRASRSQVFKYVCPCCGNSVRATKMLNIGCFDCNELMTIE